MSNSSWFNEVTVETSNIINTRKARIIITIFVLSLQISTSRNKWLISVTTDRSNENVTVAGVYRLLPVMWSTGS